MSARREAVNAIASSQEIAFQPGSGIGLRPSAQHGMTQPIRRIDDLGRCCAFNADAAVGMFRVDRHFCEAAVFDSRHHAATRDAHCAIGMYLIRSPSQIRLSAKPCQNRVNVIAFLNEKVCCWSQANRWPLRERVGSWLCKNSNMREGDRKTFVQIVDGCKNISSRVRFQLAWEKSFSRPFDFSRFYTA